MRRRRSILVFISGVVVLILLAGALPTMVKESLPLRESEVSTVGPSGSALAALNKLEVKGRAPKTGYERTQFGNGWAKVNGCSTRDIILYRDLQNTVLNGECSVISGTLNDLYTGEIIQFTKENSSAVQIDHIVALSDAWRKGAQNLTLEQRQQLANDPLELIAASGKENQAKSDGDAATWLPKNKPFRCMYVARQIAVKKKYSLWVTDAEKKAIGDVLASCPDQPLP